MQNLKIAVIGAGSTYSPEIVEGLINRYSTLPVTEIMLMDIDENKLAITGGLASRMLKAAGLPVKCTLTGSLDEALEGANYVLVQIRVGKLPARVLDEKIPLKYDLIGQETTGIGGFFKALRTIPVMMNIAEKMERLCPDAWLINFSNPSGMVAQALINEKPNMRITGLCNNPINMDRAIKKWLGTDDVQLEYVGINHLSWVTKILSGGEDRLKVLLDAAVAGTATSIPPMEFDLESFKIARGIPCGYLNYFYYPRERLAHLKQVKMSRGEECMRIEAELLELYRSEKLSEKPKQLALRGGALYSEAAINLVDCIHNDKKEEHIVNLRNNGALPFMADDDVVEIPAVVSKDAMTPVPVNNFSNRHIIDLMRTVKSYERHGVNAALHGDRDEALRALMIHPLIGDFNAAKACFDEMLEANREYLPQFSKPIM